MRIRSRTIVLCFVALLAGRAAVSEDPAGPALSRPDRAESRQDDSANNLDYWLDRAASGPAETQPDAAAEPEGSPLAPLAAEREMLPGAIELSDGTRLFGHLYTTVQKPWFVYVADQKRWRMIPFAAALSISAVVVEEKIEPRWRWKATGVPERVFTGEQYPTRRLAWEFLLADGTTIAGAVKGQPIYVRTTKDETAGPYILHERQKGEIGQRVGELVYVRKVVISKRLLEQAAAAGDPQGAPPTGGKE